MNERAAASRSNHDIRASLAITKGFQKALEGSLAELSDAVRVVFAEQDILPQSASMQRIEALEEDCHFCLLRIKRSLEQLDTRLNTDARLDMNSSSGSEQDES